MHSSSLRGTDFTICINGMACDHAEFFAGFRNTSRLGLVAPTGLEGVGAINLVMAYVTAFYDTYRSTHDNFYAYPDYFSFQSRQPLASYSMFDIWPEHKNIYVPEDPLIKLNTINDRGITILILPDKAPKAHEYHPAQLESARRNIDACYAYSATGQTAVTDITIQTSHPSLLEWAKSLLATADLTHDPGIQQQQSEWELQRPMANLTQSFRTITLEEALTLL